MSIVKIVAELRARRDRINQALAALEGLGGTGNGRRGRRRGRGPMSAAARKKISEMMKKRWAERKREST